MAKEPKGLNQDEFKEEIKFATWWATEKDNDFLRSKTIKILRETYEALDGIETIMLANLGKQYGFLEGKPVRVRLPEKRLIHIAKSQDGEMMICVSQEKGIQLKFDLNKISPEIRDATLSAFMESAKELKKGVLEHKIPLDKYGQGNRPSGWFKALENSIERNSKEGNKTAFVGAEI